MRRTLLNLSLLAVLAAPLAAHAASFYELTFASPTVTYSYIVPTTGFTTDNLSYIKYTNDVTFLTTIGSTTTSSIDTVEFVNPADGGGLVDFSPGGLNINDPTLAQLFTTFTSPTSFIPGSIPNFIEQFTLNTYTYSAAPYTPTSTAPEPSSLVLLGTGAVGLFGAFRRRFAA